MRIVIKIGGGQGIDQAATIADIAQICRSGAEIIVVHGCSAATDQLAADLGVPVRHVTTATGIRSRRTDARAIAIFAMAAARVNGEFVRGLQAAGINALGLSGADGGVLRARRKAVLRIVEGDRQLVLHDEFTGRVETVNRELLTTLLRQGFVPVLEPVALAEDATAVNVDGDRAAACVATTMQADMLIIVTNVPGLLRDPNDASSTIATLDRQQIEGFEHAVSGGMRRKLIGAREALNGGVGRVILTDGREGHPIERALAGRGTVIA